MYKIWFVSFEYYQDKEFDSLEHAIEGARQAGFESVILEHCDAEIVYHGQFSPLNGYTSRRL